MLFAFADLVEVTTGARVDVWRETAQSLGIPVVILIAVSYGIWKAAHWFGPNVLQKLTDRHISFVDQVQKLVEDTGKEVKDASRAIQELTSAVNKHVSFVDEVQKLVVESSREMRQVEVNTREVLKGVQELAKNGSDSVVRIANAQVKLAEEATKAIAKGSS